VRPQVENVRAILAEMPTAPEEWDGELREEDVEVSAVEHPKDGRMLGAQALHRPTGIGRRSISKPTYDENEEVALRALKGAVAQEYTAS
jgi:hypothetical protein